MLRISQINGEKRYEQKSQLGSNGNGVDAFTAAIIKFGNGVRASFDVGMILGEDSNARYDRLFIHGTKGDIKSEVEYNRSGEVSYRIISGGKVTERRLEVPNNYSLEIAQLSDCILKGDRPFVTEEFSIRNAELLDKLLESIDF